MYGNTLQNFGIPKNVKNYVKIIYYCLEKQKSLLRIDHPETLSTMNNLAGVYDNQAKYDEAEELYIECLEKQKSLFGIDHPDSLSTMNNLANV